MEDFICDFIIHFTLSNFPLPYSHCPAPLLPPPPPPPPPLPPPPPPPLSSLHQVQPLNHKEMVVTTGVYIRSGLLGFVGNVRKIQHIQCISIYMQFQGFGLIYMYVHVYVIVVVHNNKKCIVEMVLLPLSWGISTKSNHTDSISTVGVKKFPFTVRTTERVIPFRFRSRLISVQLPFLSVFKPFPFCPLSTNNGY